MPSSEFQQLLAEMLDGDADGYVNDEWVEEGGDDCDDDDPLVHPGAEEICTGKDNDCDGYIDEGLSDWEGWYPDVDGDGYGDMSAPLERCPVPDHAVQNGLDCDDGNGAFNPEATDLANDDQDQNCDGVDGEDLDGDGVASVTSGGEDCDDANPDISPLVEEEPYNGVDDDCDSATPDDDVDGDGFERDEDCDDEDWRVYPGAREICEDGVINNCYDSPEEAWERCGVGEVVARDARHRAILGDSTFQSIGSHFLSPGDVTGDAIPDILIGDIDPGARRLDLFLFSGFSATEVHVSDGALLSIPDIDSPIFTSIAGAGDANLDGIDELLAVITLETDWPLEVEYGLFPGPVGAHTNLDAPAVLIFSDAGFDAPYGSLDASADVDGDGVRDWLFGSLTLSDGTDPQGGAWFVRGRASGDVYLPDEGIRLISEDGTFMGAPVEFVGDVNGDGVEDIAMASYRSSLRAERAGTVHVFFGPFEQDRDISEADWTIAGEEAQGFAGFSISGSEDWDGDGLDDLVVGAPYAGASGTQGRAYVLTAGQVGRQNIESAPMVISGEQSGNLCGYDVALLPDISADGRAEVMVGTPSYDEPTTDSGLVSVFVNAGPGQWEVADGDSFITAERGDYLGSAVEVLGDISFDGVADYALGATGFTDDVAGQGAVFIFNGAGP
ncbi:MAG: FG-GAP repeat protein [Alphaproteobacteria bacterium]|nr:FG-GAP repeat protein [Alphaproteobacteria bacterium]MCB9791603.1 FG-GAP repeat protein [Alphaproteobacteria bacterium]